MSRRKPAQEKQRPVVWDACPHSLPKAAFPNNHSVLCPDQHALAHAGLCGSCERRPNPEGLRIREESGLCTAGQRVGARWHCLSCEKFSAHVAEDAQRRRLRWSLVDGMVWQLWVDGLLGFVLYRMDRAGKGQSPDWVVSRLMADGRRHTRRATSDLKQTAIQAACAALTGLDLS